MDSNLASLARYYTDLVRSGSKEQRREFLTFLKNQPEKVLNFVRYSLKGVSMSVCITEGVIVVCNYDTDPPKILDELRKSFADELANISPVQPAPVSS